MLLLAHTSMAAIKAYGDIEVLPHLPYLQAVPALCLFTLTHTRTPDLHSSLSSEPPHPTDIQNSKHRPLTYCPTPTCTQTLSRKHSDCMTLVFIVLCCTQDFCFVFIFKVFTVHCRPWEHYNLKFLCIICTCGFSQ